MRTAYRLTGKSVGYAVLACCSIIPAIASAELSGNIGASSNYIFRGITQTNDQAAISGGLDYAHDSGFYVGTWVSNVDFSGGAGTGGYEHDYYAGYAGEAAGASYDVGVISFQYPIEGGSSFPDFTEFYIGGSYSIVSAKYSYTDDFDGADHSAYYLEGALDFGLPQEIGLNLHVGTSDGDAFDLGGVDTSYADYSVTLSKGEFAFGVSHTDVDNDRPRAFVSWAKTFDL